MLFRIMYILKEALICGTIGYFTNLIALRMLFFPKKPIFKIQGLLPKYKNNFAERTADFIFQFIDFKDILTESINKKAFSNSVLSSKWGSLKKSVGFVIATEIEFAIQSEELQKCIANNLKELTPQAKLMLAKKIVDTNIDDLTDMILKNSSREIRFIQILGGMIGFTIGLVNALLTQK